MEIKLKSVAWVKNSRTTIIDDDWGGIVSEIFLAEDIPDKAFQHILDFSLLEIIYYFDQMKQDNIPYTRCPRGNPGYPEMGIFAQRNKDRPNQIGLSMVELIWHREFRPAVEVRQPAWVTDLMRKYN